MVVLANGGSLGIAGNFCFYCGRACKKVAVAQGVTPPEWALTQDHVVPRSRGGKGQDARKVTCCVKCNQDKFHLTLDEYRVVIAFRAGVLAPPAYQFAAETLPA